MAVTYLFRASELPRQSASHVHLYYVTKRNEASKRGLEACRELTKQIIEESRRKRNV